MRVAFIRHGQTEWNAEGRLQGSSDIPLNDTGRQQAREAADLLRDTTWDAIISSPLSRARETAQVIADGLRMPLGRSYDLLIERDYGEAEGVVVEDALQRWPDRQYPGTEPEEKVISRGMAALQQISEEFVDKNVLVVGHGTFIRVTLSAIAGRPFSHILNGSISTVEAVGAAEPSADAWQVVSVNGKALTPSV